MTPSSSSEQMNSPFTGTYGWSHVVPEQIHIMHFHGFLKSELSVWLQSCMTAQWNWKIQALQKDTDTGVLFYLLCISFLTHNIKKERKGSLGCRYVTEMQGCSYTLDSYCEVACAAVSCCISSGVLHHSLSYWKQRAWTVATGYCEATAWKTDRWLFHFCWPFLVILLWKSIIIWTVQRSSIRWVKASCECETETAVFRKCASYPTIHQ